VIFQYHSEILERFPQVVGGVILVDDVHLPSSSPSLRRAFTDEQQLTLQRVGDTPLSQIDALAAWRGAFRQFGVKPTQYRSASEALLRRLTKHGDIPSINVMVDLANLVSIRYALPVAAFDLRAVEGAITVKFAKGDERFTPLGQNEIQHPEPGEVIFADETDLVLARRWCWRQSDESASRPETERVLITIESHHDGGELEVRAGVRDLLELVEEFAGSKLFADVLSVDNPSFAEEI
jgi:DNA/RNA-binding domain of Phe-tRNA-synthetase-like protein